MEHISLKTNLLHKSPLFGQTQELANQETIEKGMHESYYHPNQYLFLEAH